MGEFEGVGCVVLLCSSSALLRCCSSFSLRSLSPTTVCELLVDVDEDVDEKLASIGGATVVLPFPRMGEEASSAGGIERGGSGLTLTLALSLLPVVRSRPRRPLSFPLGSSPLPLCSLSLSPTNFSLSTLPPAYATPIVPTIPMSGDKLPIGLVLLFPGPPARSLSHEDEAEVGVRVLDRPLDCDRLG